MTTLVICPCCERAVPADAPRRLCPECLFRHSLTGVDDPTFVPEATSPKKARSPNLDELKASFPNLEMIEFIGAGGMGSVYRARQKSLDRIVALKVLHQEFSSDPAFAERFGREARAMAKLNHPHIVGVYESGRAGSYYYLLMEYVAGVTLREMMNGKKLDAATALALTPQICEALEYAHGEGVVHRDIKPENILVDRRGGVKIADFGLAKLTGQIADGAALTRPQQVMGTLHYMAPEQMRGELGVDHRADIYSLGVVIYEMLTGHLPLGRFEPPSQRVLVDVRIDDVVLRTLERDPDRRYQRAVQVKTEIDSICQRADHGTTVRAAPNAADRLRHRLKFANFFVFLAILLMSILPWGMAEQRTKHDLDFQFMLNSGSAFGDSVYRRVAGLEFSFLPEGTRLSAWGSSIGLRIPLFTRATSLNWMVELPNWLIPIETIVIGVMLAYRLAGRGPPGYLIPLISFVASLQILAGIIALERRGDVGFAPFLALLCFAWWIVEPLLLWIATHLKRR